jgi:cysteinyl-tRNA synthetase
MKSALEDDLNTAQAQAAIFDMVRKTNAAVDAGQIRKDDVPPLLTALDKFDEIFSVLRDDDAAKMKAILAWAKTQGREDISQTLLDAVGSQSLSDSEIEKKIAQMEGARRARDFKLSDAIRAELTGAGLIVEQTKDGIRWRRK